MKQNIIILLLLFVNSSFLFSQTQQKIKWPSLADSPWPVLNGDMQGTGRSDYVGPTSSNPYIHWMADLPLGIFWGPTLGYDDILYFGSYALDSDLENHFYAYFPDGNPYWIFNTSTGYPNNFSPLITKDSSVYMKSNDGVLYCLTHNGNLKWTSYVGFGGMRMHFSLDLDGNIYAFSQDTLRILNSQGIEIQLKYIKDISSPVIFSPDGGTIYFKTGHKTNWEQDHSLVAADLEGNIVWRYWFFETNEAPVTVDNQGNIYCYGTDSTNGIKHFIYSFTENGEIRWKYPTDGYFTFNSVTVDIEGNILFYCRKDNGSTNYIVSLKNNGELNWEVRLKPDENPYFAQVNHGLTSDANGNIYFGSRDGVNFYAMNKYGEFLWTLSLNGYGYFSSPAIGSDGTLYIGTSLSTFFQNHQNNLIAINDEPLYTADDNKPIISLELAQNYPNPFNFLTKIEYSVENPDWIKLNVYNFLGEFITTLVDEYKSRGMYNINFNAENLASGIYFYTIISGTNFETKKMVLLR
ncbi:MAG: PQQ-binding-like beta-propeller repeat protein [Ignavibacterium sp.]|nr:PQQ-binding-like beta-propeller repeat protein [Ignavibacterium sp.]